MRALVLDPLGLLHYVWAEGRMLSIAGALDARGVPMIARSFETAAVFTLLRTALRNEIVPIA